MASDQGSRPGILNSERRFPSKELVPSRVGNPGQEGKKQSLSVVLNVQCVFVSNFQDTDEYKYVGSELKHLVDQMKSLMSERKQKQAEKASHHRRSRSAQNGYNR